MKANSNITALKEAAEAQFKLNPDGALMLDPQFCLFCVEEYERSLTALLSAMAVSGKDAKAKEEAAKIKSETEEQLK